MKLIDKNKLLEGLKTLKQNLSASPIVVIEDVESLVENLEVKEVDLEKEVTNWWNGHYKKINDDYEFGKYNRHYMEKSTIISFAKHFFELGMQQSKNEELQ